MKDHVVIIFVIFVFVIIFCNQNIILFSRE